MKQNILTLGIVLVFLISACAPQATPTVNPADIQHTAEAAAFTMVAQTEESKPTDTPLPPTEAASPTLPPSLTPIPSETTDPLLATATGLSSSVSTPVPQATANCNKPLTEWDGPSASFTVINETRPRGDIVLSLYVVADRGECGYLLDLSQGPVGQYSAGAFVDGDRDFKVFGGFRITEGSWKITVRNNAIVALGSCYPGC